MRQQLRVRGAGGAAKDHASAPLVGRSRRTGRNNDQLGIQPVKCDLSPEQLWDAVRGDVPITAAMFEIETKGKDRYTRKRQHLTPRGQIVAAVRKCLSNIAATDMGKLLLTDISKDSFLKAEIILGATRVCSFRKFHEMFEQKLTASTSTTPGLVVHSFSDSAAEVGVRVRNPESRAPERVLLIWVGAVMAMGSF